MTSDNCFYVYMLFRLGGAPCYVGKGKGNRYRDHFRKSANPHLANIIAKSGGELPVAIVGNNITETEAFALERELIACIGREAHGGPLVNCTDGGEGFTGGRHTPETLKRMGAGISAALKGRPKNAAEIASKPCMQKGVLKSESQKAKMAAARVGRKLSATHKANIGAAHKGMRRPEETRSRMSAAARVNGERCPQGHDNWFQQKGKRGYLNRKCRTCKRERDRNYRKVSL